MNTPSGAPLSVGNRWWIVWYLLPCLFGCFTAICSVIAAWWWNVAGAKWESHDSALHKRGGILEKHSPPHSNICLLWYWRWLLHARTHSEDLPLIWFYLLLWSFRVSEPRSRVQKDQDSLIRAWEAVNSQAVISTHRFTTWPQGAFLAQGRPLFPRRLKVVVNHTLSHLFTQTPLLTFHFPFLFDLLE